MPHSAWLVPAALALLRAVTPAADAPPPSREISRAAERTAERSADIASAERSAKMSSWLDARPPPRPPRPPQHDGSGWREVLLWSETWLGEWSALPPPPRPAVRFCAAWLLTTALLLATSHGLCGASRLDVAPTLANTLLHYCATALLQYNSHLPVIAPAGWAWRQPSLLRYCTTALLHLCATALLHDYATTRLRDYTHPSVIASAG